MHSFKYHNQHYFDIKTDYTMTFILPELSLCLNSFLFVQKINITRNTNIKHMYMINVTALKDPTCSAICILVLKRTKKKPKNTFMNYCVNYTNKSSSDNILFHYSTKCLAQWIHGDILHIDKGVRAIHAPLQHFFNLIST